MCHSSTETSLHEITIALLSNPVDSEWSVCRMVFQIHQVLYAWFSNTWLIGSSTHQSHERNQLFSLSHSPHFLLFCTYIKQHSFVANSNIQLELTDKKERFYYKLTRMSHIIRELSSRVIRKVRTQMSLRDNWNSETCASTFSSYFSVSISCSHHKIAPLFSRKYASFFLEGEWLDFPNSTLKHPKSGLWLAMIGVFSEPPQILNIRRILKYIIKNLCSGIFCSHQSCVYDVFFLKKNR